LHSRIKNEEPLWLCPCEGLRRAGSKPPSPVHRRVLGAILAEAHARAYGSNLCRNDGSRESLELPAGRLLRHYDEVLRRNSRISSSRDASYYSNRPSEEHRRIYSCSAGAT